MRRMSEASGASTSSLLGPPDRDNIERKEYNNKTDYFSEGAKRMGSASRASTQSERMASKRRVDPDTMRPPSPSPSQSSFLDRYSDSTSKMQGNFTIEVSASFHYTPFHCIGVVHSSYFLVPSRINLIYYPASNIHRPD